MKLLIGIDGGGTKTDAVLCDETGSMLARYQGGATGPSAHTDEAIEAVLRALLEQLLKDHGGLLAPVDSLYAGISGCGLPAYSQRVTAILHKLLPNGRSLQVGSDAQIALTSALGRRDGLVAIAGTGSCVYARQNGVMRKVGGWGYLLGDEGSGYDLGRRALIAALRAQEGRGSDTLLRALCEKQLGQPVLDAIPDIYREGRTRIAAFAPCLMAAAEAGDEVACRQWEEAARELAQTIQAAGRLLPQTVKTVVMAGSVWTPGGYYETRIAQWLGPDYHLTRSDQEPVSGAALEALYAVGCPEADFRANYAQTVRPAIAIVGKKG